MGDDMPEMDAAAITMMKQEFGGKNFPVRVGGMELQQQ